VCEPRLPRQRRPAAPGVRREQVAAGQRGSAYTGAIPERAQLRLVEVAVARGVGPARDAVRAHAVGEGDGPGLRRRRSGARGRAGGGGRGGGVGGGGGGEGGRAGGGGPPPLPQPAASSENVATAAAEARTGLRARWLRRFMQQAHQPGLSGSQRGLRGG